MHFPKGNPKEVMAEFDCPAGRVKFLADGTGKLVLPNGTEEAISPAVAQVLAFTARAIDEAQRFIEERLAMGLLRELAGAQKQCKDPNCAGCVARRKAAEEAKSQRPIPPKNRLMGFETEN